MVRARVVLVAIVATLALAGMNSLLMAQAVDQTKLDAAFAKLASFAPYVAGDSFSITPSAPDLDIFATLDRAIATLKNPAANSGQVAQAVNGGLRDMDAVMGHMQAARAEAGSQLNRLDALDARNQDRALWAKTVQADAEDLDMLQAISTFQNQQTGYQAALQSYAMVQRLSLFDYVK